VTADLRRSIPSVDALLRAPAVQHAIRRFGRATVLRAIQAEVRPLRALAAQGEETRLLAARESLVARIVERTADAGAPSLRRVINATGVVVHTNLGRSPLPEDALRRVADIGSGYSNLEFDLETGERGQRETHAEARLQRLVGAEASVVVNNNAAAVLLAVNTFAEGRDVLVSRGELVEIGGSFRIPDVLRKAGARLVEVGTTNRTRASDYANAVSEQTGLILRVHPSNFRVVGFTEAASLQELSELGRARSLPVVEDAGSGQLQPRPSLPTESHLQGSLASGAGVVTASGDKLLGGPQAGLIAGKTELVSAMRRNPLYRALRVDKLTIAALDAVLELHERGDVSLVPTARMLDEPVSSVEARAADVIRRALDAGVKSLTLTPALSRVGGGAAPDVTIASFGIALPASFGRAHAVQRALRQRAVPIVARIHEDTVLLDFRTVLPGDEALIEEALIELAQASPETTLA
jgi:L-seryl-tRNA(Ser) seleniumtransferase